MTFEQVDLTAKLSGVMSQLTNSQLSLTELRKTEQELREQFNALQGINYRQELHLTSNCVYTTRNQFRILSKIGVASNKNIFPSDIPPINISDWVQKKSVQS